MPRILSVEDDPDLQHLISTVLRNQGYEVHYAFTGPEGYEKALALSPDLILLDLMLPGLNGAELAAKLQEHKGTRGIPLIVLTAFGSDSNFVESRLRSMGAVDYLRKPVDFDELLRLIKRVLDGRASSGVPAIWSRGVFRIVPETRAVWIADKLAGNLSPKRFEVLFHLLQAAGEVPWEQLVLRVWGPNGNKNELEKTVSRLREDLGAEGYRVSTTRAGYQLIA